jgi:hypothetical protein
MIAGGMMAPVWNRHHVSDLLYRDISTLGVCNVPALQLVLSNSKCRDRPFNSGRLFYSTPNSRSSAMHYDNCGLSRLFRTIFMDVCRLHFCFTTCDDALVHFLNGPVRSGCRVVQNILPTCVPRLSRPKFLSSVVLSRLGFPQSPSPLRHIVVAIIVIRYHLFGYCLLDHHRYGLSLQRRLRHLCWFSKT